MLVALNSIFQVFAFAASGGSISGPPAGSGLSQTALDVSPWQIKERAHLPRDPARRRLSVPEGGKRRWGRTA